MDNKKGILDDKDILFDMLQTQCYLTNCYNAAGNRATDPKIHDELLNIQSEEHQIVFDVLGELTKRGFYGVEQAQAVKIQQVKQDYSARLLNL